MSLLFFGKPGKPTLFVFNVPRQDPLHPLNLFLGSAQDEPAADLGAGRREFARSAGASAANVHFVELEGSAHASNMGGAVAFTCALMQF
ncbi:hypothetical protein [Pseudovibrio sp. SPO723]|uniref:hypothetical protein n=1 Tax=Nesiotobacter zosterae TaxID=392721 RepID=UPI0029C1D786|nr:hypothetical protein [Pseudovibrio sp. SPO723]MDX5593362.1 hypothetical protein [Pseudovibrio sp. SPO723]